MISLVLVKIKFQASRPPVPLDCIGSNMGLATALRRMNNCQTDICFLDQENKMVKRKLQYFCNVAVGQLYYCWTFSVRTIVLVKCRIFFKTLLLINDLLLLVFHVACKWGMILCTKEALSECGLKHAEQIALSSLLSNLRLINLKMVSFFTCSDSIKTMIFLIAVILGVHFDERPGWCW